MKEYTLFISVLTATLLLGGCETLPKDDNKPKTEEVITLAQNTSPTKPQQEEEQTKPEVEMDYTVRGACGYFSDLFGEKSWFYTYGNSVDKASLDIVDDNTEEIIEIQPDNSYIYNSKIVQFVKPDKQNATLLKSHTQDNLLFSCIYRDERADKEQVFHSFVPLDDPQIWQKKNKSNDALIYGSFLSDLQYKIYKKNYNYTHDKTKALEDANAFMKKAFPGGVYNVTNYSGHVDMWGFHDISRPKTLQASYYRKLNDLAWNYTDKRVDFLNDVIADNYESYYLNHNGCIDDWVCSSIFPDATEKLLDDPEFHYGLTYWQQTEELYGSATGTITKSLVSSTPRKYDIELSMFASHKEDTPLSYVDIHQDYKLENVSELDMLNLKIKSKKLYGTTTSSWNFTSSGIAGYYACFNDSSNHSLGCMIIADYTDRLIIDTRIGMMFDLHSTPSLYIVKGDREAFEGNYNLGQIVREDLPKVKQNLSDVSSVRVGAFVGEATQIKECIKCKSYLEAEMISLEKVK